MKTAILIFALCFSFVACSGEDVNSSPDNIDPSPVLHVKLNTHRLAIATTMYLVPGQEVRIDNPVFTHVHLMSDLPIIVQIGKCEATQTTDIRCETTPNLYIHFQDLRDGTPADGAPLNRIYLTFTKE